MYSLDFYTQERACHAFGGSFAFLYVVSCLLVHLVILRDDVPNQLTYLA
jgi:hypothetical protein